MRRAFLSFIVLLLAGMASAQQAEVDPAMLSYKPAATNLTGDLNVVGGNARFYGAIAAPNSELHRRQQCARCRINLGMLRGRRRGSRRKRDPSQQDRHRALGDDNNREIQIPIQTAELSGTRQGDGR